jgi:hypothetical protein
VTGGSAHVEAGAGVAADAGAHVDAGVAADAGVHVDAGVAADAGAGVAADAGAQALLDRYAAIHAHAELELELAGAGELDRLDALDGRWDELIEGLPAQPPPAAAELLHRARLIHERTHIELERLRGALLADIATTTRSRRAADGYAGQLRRRPRLDRSA